MVRETEERGRERERKGEEDSKREGGIARQLGIIYTHTNIYISPNEENYQHKNTQYHGTIQDSNFLLLSSSIKKLKG